MHGNWINTVWLRHDEQFSKSAKIKHLDVLIIYRLIPDFKLYLKSVSLYLLKADYMNLPLSNKKCI